MNYAAYFSEAVLVEKIVVILMKEIRKKKQQNKMESIVHGPENQAVWEGEIFACFPEYFASPAYWPFLDTCGDADWENTDWIQRRAMLSEALIHQLEKWDAGRRGRSGRNKEGGEGDETASSDNAYLFVVHNLLNRVRLQALEKVPGKIAPQKIIPDPALRDTANKKSQGEENKKVEEARAISTYGLAERLLTGQLNHYLRDLIDEYFSESSYAYRKRKNRHGHTLTHHDAVQELAAYRNEHSGQALWVAECDIRGFFDLIPHSTIRTCFDELEKTLIADGKEIDDRLKQNLDVFLSSYNYRDTVLAHEEEWLGSEKNRLCFKRHKGLADNTEVCGIPQGAPLSQLLANIVLDRADRAIETQFPRVLYLRFCDDVIFVSPDKKAVAGALRRYIKTLRKLKLPFYPPQKTGKYPRMQESAFKRLQQKLSAFMTGKSRKNAKNSETKKRQTYWEAKSKAPYCWKKPDGEYGIPWVSFLGYQVRYDGLFRIRKQSVDKEKRQLLEQADEALHEIHKRDTIKVYEANRILRRFRASQVARIRGRHVFDKLDSREWYRQEHSAKSWGQGFRLLRDYPHVRTPLKLLDSMAVKQCKRVRNGLRKKLAESGEQEEKAKPEWPQNLFRPDLSYQGTMHYRYKTAEKNPE